MKKTNILRTALLPLTLASSLAYADFNAEVGVYSDYRDNGVSWSDRDPAVQAGIGYAHDSGLYLGTWASNVNYGSDDDTKLEWQWYVGYEHEFNESFSASIEAATYFYLGGHDTSDGNYQEFSGTLTFFENTSFTAIFAPAYFGESTYTYSLVLSQDIPFAEHYNLNLAVSRSETGDAEKFTWDEEHDYYHAAQATLSREWKGFTFSATASTTSIKTKGEDGKSAVVFGISKAWDW